MSALCRNLSLNVLQTGSTWHCTASRVGSLTETEADLAYWKFCVFGERKAANSGRMAIRAPTEDKHVVRLRRYGATSARRRYFGWDGATSMRRSYFDETVLLRMRRRYFRWDGAASMRRSYFGWDGATSMRRRYFGWDGATSMRRRDFGWDGATLDETALLRWDGATSMRPRYFDETALLRVGRRSERAVASFSFSMFVAIVAWPHHPVVSNKMDLCAV